MNPVIYVPKGPAREYSPLAANLYTGCAHGCKYCYAPAVLRRSREAFGANVKPRAGVLEQLARDAKRLAAAGDKGPVLLSFTSDPYQPCEEEHCLTQRAIRILADAGLRIRILTKNPPLAVSRDLALLQEARVEFGVSLTFRDDDLTRYWEPNAATFAERSEALTTAYQAGLRTWASLEPVIVPNESLSILDLRHVHTWKIGKLNHDNKREASIDWRQFLEAVLSYLNARGRFYYADYYIKNDLWKFAGDEIKGKWARERSGTVKA